MIMKQRIGYLNLYARDVAYNISIYNKYTVITGFSGIGKSQLLIKLREIFNATNNLKVYSPIYKIQSSKSVSIIDSSFSQIKLTSQRSWIEALYWAFKPDTIICVDEDFEYLYTHDFQQAMIEFDALFIIICRDRLRFIPYGIEDIFRLQLAESGDYHFNQNIYNPELHNVKEFTNYSILCTEDSGSGYKFFGSFLSRVDTSGGKMRIPKLIQSCKDTVFCLDGLGFGNEFVYALNILERFRTRNNAFWFIDSFESLILNSEWFRSLGYISNLDRSKSNLEKQATEVLRGVLERNHIRYTKSKIPSCFIKDCCFDQYHHTPSHKCGLFCSGNKLELILGKDLLDNLIKAFGDARAKDDKIPALAGAGSQQLSAKGYSSNLKLEYEEIPNEASKDEDIDLSLDTDLFTNVF